MSRKRTLIKGTFILTITGFITRFMGFFYRIFLSHTFGEEGVGIYQLVFPIYALAFSLTSAGIETALSHCVATHLSKGQKKEVRNLLYTSLLITITFSCVITLFIQRNALWIAQNILQETRCENLLVILSYALPFAALHSCIVGFYFGQKETKVPAISQLLEQTFRIMSVFLICYISSLNGNSVTISVAVAGIIVGEIASSFYCFYKMRNGNVFAPVPHMPFYSFYKNAKKLLILSVPLTANRVLLNILQSVESISIPILLQMYGMANADALSVYGVLTGMALPCVLFPSAITNSVSTMLLPTVAEIQAAHQKKALSNIIQKTLFSCILLGCCCCAALLICGKWIGELLFHSSLAGDFILTLSWMCPFLYTNNTYISIINGIGKTHVSFTINSFSLCLRIMSVFFLIPVYGICGYLWGLLGSQIFTFLVCSFYIYHFCKKSN